MIISATLSPGESPARVFDLWRGGAFELIVSPLLLWELAGVLARGKFGDLVRPDEVEELLSILRVNARSVSDPSEKPQIRSSDPDDGYLIALAESSRSVLVSGDRDLLELSEQIPVYSLRTFLALLQDSP